MFNLTTSREHSKEQYIFMFILKHIKIEISVSKKTGVRITEKKAVQNHLICFNFMCNFLFFLYHFSLNSKKTEESLNFQFKVKAFVKQVTYKMISK